MKKSKVLFAAIFSIFIFTTLALAEPRSIIMNPRISGMGGAFTAVADDENAMFFNPAGLSRNNVKKIGIFTPQISLGDGYTKLLDAKDDLDAAVTDAQTAAVLKKLIPLNVPVGLSFSPYWLGGNYGAMIFGGGFVRGEILNPVSPRVEAEGYYDVTLMGSYSMPVKENFNMLLEDLGAGLSVPNDLYVGATLKIINRNKLVEKVSATNPATAVEDPNKVTLNTSDINKITSSGADEFIDTKSASGIGLDVGVLYNVMENLNASFVLRDIAGTSFDFGSNLKSHIEPTLTLGAAYKMAPPEQIADYAGDLLLAFDYDRALNGGSFWTKLHFGAETTALKFIKLRLGLNQGYPTIGFGYRTGGLQLDYAWYQEERGRFAGQQGDQYHVIGLGLGF